MIRRLAALAVMIPGLICGAPPATRADTVLDDFSSGGMRRWDLSDTRVASATVGPGGPEGKPCLALTSRGYAGWAAISLSFDSPMDLRGKYLSVWLKQDDPATVQFEFNCQPGPNGYPSYFLHEVPDFVGSWQHLYLRLDARAILWGEPRHDQVVRLRISRLASGPQGTVYLADLRIVDQAPDQRLALLPQDVARFTPRGRGAGPLPPPQAPVMLGTTATGRKWTTDAPFIDLLNYEEKLTPEYVARMAANSPDVFHAGNVAPFKPYWGPSRDHSFAESPLIGPDEVRKQIAGLREFVARMKAAGIGRVLSSSCSITIGGSPTKRLGMWAFYDHWDDYLSFGLPAKPAHDPLTWNQQDAAGKDRNPYGQPFTPWTDQNPDFDRYTPCPSNPEWLAYSKFVIKMIAESGFDGVFIDNNSIEGCCCDACLAGFREWLARRYSPARARQYLGLDDPAQADLRQLAAGPPLLRQEAADFWADQLRRFLTECQAAGETVHRGFLLCPNWTGAQHIWSRDHAWPRLRNAWPMRELDLPLGEGETDAFGQQPGYWGTVQWYKLDARMHTPGSGQTIMLNYQTQSANRCELAQAESAAFGEGAVHCALAGGPDVQAVYARYRRFYREHRDLFAPLESYAQVGVPCFRNGSSGALALGRMLLDAHVPFDFMDSRDLTTANLVRFPVLVCNNAPQVSDAELQVLDQYLRHGGRLIIAGGFASEDELCQPRKHGPVLDLILAGERRPCLRSVGAGTFIYTPLTMAPSCRQVASGLLGLAGVSPVVAGGPRPGLRVNTYADRKHIAVHLVNFRVPERGDPLAQTDLTLQVPLPAAWPGRALKVTFWQPGAEPQPLTAGKRGGTSRVVIPRLRIYGVLEVRPAG